MCGECGTKCDFIPEGSGKSYGEYICPACGAHVRIHEGTDIPLGVPAGKETARKRIMIHKEIDRLIDEGYSREGVYRLLSRKMGIPSQETHAGMFGLNECNEALKILTSVKGPL